MKLENIKNIRLAQVLKIRLKNRHLRVAFFAPISFLQASSSATILVVDMFIPAEARLSQTYIQTLQVKKLQLLLLQLYLQYRY